MDLHKRITQLPSAMASADSSSVSRPVMTSETGRTLHRLFEAAVDRWGERAACRVNGESTTYQALDRRANQLAHRLRALGVGRESRVAIHLERSFEMLVSIVAVLKAGGAYVPLDPEHPAERRSFCIADSGAVMLVSRKSLWTSTMPPAETHLLCLDEEAAGLLSESDQRLADDSSPDDLAYVIYTSGSTGTPKGVMVTHHNVARLFTATDAWFGFGSDDVWTLFHSFAFDFSVWEMWGALLYGGKVVVIPYLMSRTPLEMARLLVDEGVSVLCQTPSAFRQLAPAVLAAEISPRLRYVIFGGEALEFQTLRVWFERFGDQRPVCINMYGITETTVHATYRPVSRADALSDVPSYIGVPLPDLELLLWNDRGEPVDTGEVGEIIVAGAGVARGYLGHSDLTRERFLVRDGRRYYRSGDLACLLPGGELQYLGRGDGQVKLRGFRIETGEIATRIVDHGAIADAVVRVVGEADRARLIAYCVVASGKRLDRRELRRELRRFLPDSMLPAAFVELDRLPLTINGKLDIDALPVPEVDAALYRAPQSEMERLLALIWREVLETPSPIGLDDSFLALGGNSIAAARVLQRIREECSVALTFRDLFDAGTLSDLARTIHSQASEGPDEGPAPRPSGSASVLSFAEEQFLVVSRLTTNLPMYSECLVIRIAASLDFSRLEHALTTLSHRHIALRSSYLSEDGKVRRVSRPAGDLPVTHHDLRALSREQRVTEFMRSATDRVRQGFDLAAPPLLRVDVYTLADQDHRVLLSFHHIVMDGEACATVLRGLATRYSQASSEVTPDTLDIDDVAAWQRQQLAETRRRHLAYWRDRLAGMQDLALPTDHSRPLLRSFRGGRVHRCLPMELVTQLKELAAESRTTLFTVLLGTFFVLLNRHTGQSDIAIGTFSAGRKRPETTEVVGCLVNPILLRQIVEPSQPFETLLTAVRSTLLEAQDHDELPFATLVRELGAAGDPTKSPLFQIAISTNVPISAPLPDWSVDISPFDNGTSRYDLGLQVDERADGVDLYFEYALDLFEPATVERMADRYVALLAAIARDASVPVCELTLIDEKERQTLAQWSQGEPTTKGVPMLDRLQRHAHQRPHAIAATYQESSLTYGELDKRSDDLAAQLTAHGVEAEGIVGLCTPASIDWLVGMIGVLKAGAAFLPLDPKYPRVRLEAMLADAGVKVLCTGDGVSDQLTGVGGHRIKLATCRGLSSPRALPSLSPHSLAYVIYTSGSTGAPKGAMIEHGGLTSLVESSLRLFELNENDRMSQLASPGFDASILEAFPILAAGGTLVIAEPNSRLPGEQMAEFLAHQRITTMFCVPSTLAMLPTRPLPELRLIALGADRLTTDIVDRWGPGRTLLNLYGPTEATVFATAARCSVSSGKPPIGRPIGGTYVYIVDERLRPVPIGIPGELLIGGRGVGRGYLHHPELTAARFLLDPVVPNSGGRVYRTGDLVRLRNDGQLDFLSRIDRQVKLRGFRIEPSEIEAALLRQPVVAQALVVLREDRPGEQRLVAYVVPRDPGSDLAELRTQLAKELPDFMIPAAFVALHAIPLSSTGKVDLRALPLPTFSSAPSAPPASALERTVADLWCEVLQLAEIGMEDPFFEVGGDSLSLMRMQALLKGRLHADIDMTTLLGLPTVRALAAHLEDRAPALPVVTIHPPALAEPEVIAIIGMAIRGPGVRNLDELWPLLVGGRDAITRWTEAEASRKRRPPNFVHAEGVLAEADAFDAEFFAITATDAALMDPQHRVFLEAAWAALEDAGYDPRRYQGRVGVFAGSGTPRHWLGPVTAALAGEATGTLAARAELYNAPEFLTSRTAFKLGLRGPVITVNTACSTALAAVHLARQALLAGECEMAIAGGVSIASLSSDEHGYVAAEGGILSRDGYCRPFSNKANGTVKASGVALVVLKRLADAERDEDAVRAVVLGSAMNNDGGDKIGFSAPSEEGQVAVLEQAYATARIDPATLAFIQAHGTGTALGDAIEVAALKRVIGAPKTHDSISLTSVKANLGHLDAAAGAAGLIAAVVALAHRTVPGMPGVQAANPLLDLSGSAFVVHEEARPLVPRIKGKEHTPLRAGVSSFGIGGTNVHIVLQAVSERSERSPYVQSATLLCLSGRTGPVLDQMVEALKPRLTGSSPAELASAAYTLAVGRTEFLHRRALVLQEGEDVAHALSDPNRWLAGKAPGRPSIVFLFPGQGEQCVNVGRELYREYPRFRTEVDALLSILREGTGLDLSPYLIDGDATRKAQLDQASLAQPATFVISYALARLLISWGIAPSALFGHSLGEYAAACLAGVFSVRDALRLLWERGRLMDSVAPGAMASVFAERSEVEPLLPPGVSIATEAAGCTVISGPLSAIDGAEQLLNQHGFACTRLPHTRAYHSSMMETIREPFAEKVRTVALRAPSFPVVSCVTGTWLTAEESTSAAYWASHLCGTVALKKGFHTLRADSSRVFVDVGPGKSMLGFLRRHPGAAEDVVCVAALPKPGNQQEAALLLQALGRLWTRGAAIDWKTFFSGRSPGRISLPTYPFERHVYRIESPTSVAHSVLPEAPPATPVPIIRPFRLDEELVQLDTHAQTLAAQVALRTVDERPGVRERLNALCAALIRRYLAQTAQIRTGQSSRITDLRARLRILPKFVRMFDFLLGVVHENGMAIVSPDQVHWLDAPSPDTLRDSFLRDYSELTGLVRYLDYCIAAYPDALSGQVESVGVLYPDGTDAFYRQCMTQSAELSSERLCLRLGRQVAADFVRRLGRKAKVLEVGAGHGTLTWPLLELLRQDDVEYHFTDIGRSFLTRAKEVAAQRGLPGLSTGRLDLNMQPEGQGYARGSFDLVLGFNAVHTARDTAQTVAWLKDLLTPSGMLILVEGTRAELWERLIWGLAPGFWDVTDRPRGSILHSADDWRSLAQQARFPAFTILPHAGRERHDHVVLLAQQGQTFPTVKEHMAAVPEDDSGRGLLAQIWQRLLGVERIDPSASFFDLEGDSLLAVQLLAEVRVRLGVTIKIPQFSQSPTFEGLLRLLTQAAPPITHPVPSLECATPEPLVPSSCIVPLQATLMVAEKVDGTNSEEAELLDVARRFLAMSTAGPRGDEVVDALFLHDPHVLLFDSYESNICGFEAIHKTYGAEYQAISDPQMKMYDPFVRIAPGGQAACVAALIDATLLLRRSRRPVSFPRTRVTWVFERHGGAWKVVHVHYSIPVGTPLRAME